ncbi:CDP-diacylglycerol--glycerol-3-phosphate 3-phosphatidyltransferase [Formicincola oecophyllae]|uniref:CDP-diacylglycerol--glycerol-3-phosphate 3-phosphatidyltransferase n=1 Tax=Formicincola oecophyllae TaxID=2558361 RepID=A0A4Y6UAL3_9PROT|nr:CDP-diacylglycerol--glycerol-3-phosphate 3-phosphatidyltransferase [Formicincola oecophyllae]QDH13980.1 CDP-diacylglycerol--glycerol-3-phosphate 3-phosphatidyltransferase [Formicincola oecophyllae]
MLMNLPNLLTFFRIGIIPLLVLLLSLEPAWCSALALAIYLAACVTDYLDGFLARAYHQQSELGRMLDPIADKLLVGALLIMLAAIHRYAYGALYAAIIIMMREITVSGLREFMAGRKVIHVSRAAKWKTGLQMVALGFLVAGDQTATLLAPLHLGWIPAVGIGSVLLWLSAALTLWTGWSYLRASADYM